jgi:hypothetical protein
MIGNCEPWMADKKPAPFFLSLSFSTRSHEIVVGPGKGGMGAQEIAEPLHAAAWRATQNNTANSYAIEITV